MYIEIRYISKNAQEDKSMKISIIGRKFHVTDDLKEKVQKKLSKLDKFFSDEADANVTMRSCKNDEILEITIFYKGTMFRSEVSDEKIENALDKSVDIIERQIRKNKTRLEKKFKTGVFETIDTDEIEEEINITKTKQFKISAMSAEEAVLQMNLLGHSFFLYQNEEDGNVNVVYKKANDEYGIIEPIV